MKRRNGADPADHLNKCLAHSRWIWPECYCYLYNHFAQFHRVVELDQTPRHAKLLVTADKSYRLWVNGEQVCRGPARGYQRAWPIDEVDVAPQLKCGRNVIAAEAYNPGISTFSYIHQTHAAFLCEPALHAPRHPFRRAWERSAWHMRRAPGHRTDTARLSVQMDFQEHLDLNVDDRNWITSTRSRTEWKAELFPPQGHNMTHIPFGRPPYDRVEPRGIPPLRSTITVPTHVTAAMCGPSGEGFGAWQNLTWPWIDELKSATSWEPPDSVRVKRTRSGLTIIIEPTTKDAFRCITIAVGHYCVGCLQVDVSGAAGGEILDFHHEQFLRDGKPSPPQPGLGCNIALSNRLRLRPGRNRHEFFHPLGFGHVTIVGRCLTRPLRVRLRVRELGYPLERNGTFECSDPTLNQIHEACRHTQQLCSLDAFVDTPWREQAQWWGDARVQARNVFYIDGDTALFERGLRSLAGQTVRDSLVPGHAPTSALWCTLPDFSLTWIVTLWDHYWQTGRTELIHELWPRVQQILSYYDRPAHRHATGLLRHDPTLWLFEDWADLPKEGIPAFYNLWYLFTLQSLIRLLTAASMSTEAVHWKKQAARIKTAIDRHLYNSSRHHFHSAVTDQLRAYAPPSVHDHVLAIMTGLRPTAHSLFIDRFLLPFLLDQPLEGATPSSFWSTYLFELMIRRGYGDQVIKCIRKRWSPMLSTGTTWEEFHWSERSTLSAAHAYAAHPCFHLVDATTGIRQTSPAWRSVAFHPPQLSELTDAVVALPTPQGLVSVRVKRDGPHLRARYRTPGAMKVVVIDEYGKLHRPSRSHFNWRFTLGLHK